MKLNNFKLEALTRVNGVKNIYKVIDTEIIDGTSYHTIGMEYENTHIYFEIEAFADDFIDYDWIYEDAQEAIERFEMVRAEPKYEEQIYYIMNSSLSMYVKEYRKLKGKFLRKGMEKLRKYVRTLVDQNKEDFLKTYKEFVNNAPVREIFES